MTSKWKGGGGEDKQFTDQENLGMKSSFMVIFSNYFLFHNKPRSHYRLIYTISLPQLRQLKGAKGFLRSRLTDLPLICTMAPRSPVSGTSKPPTTRLRQMYRPRLHCCRSAVCCVGGWRANRASKIKTGVAERSECGSLEAGGDNRGEETQVTPAEWRAVA